MFSVHTCHDIQLVEASQLNHPNAFKATKVFPNAVYEEIDSEVLVVYLIKNMIEVEYSRKER